MERLFRHAFVPALLVLAIVAWARHASIEGALQRSKAGLGFTTAALLASIALIWIVEQLVPANPAWNYNLAADAPRAISRFGRDLFYLTFVTLGSALLIQFGFGRIQSALLAHGYGFDRPKLWPTQLPLAIRIALAFLIVELMSYWVHRAAHRFKLLWRFHSTHHVITELTGIKAIRTHPIDNLFFHIARTTPLLLAGAGMDEVSAVVYLGSVLGILAHANIRVSEGPLGWVVNFPGYHQVHHSAVISESQSNFGCHTVIWDRVFGTFRTAPREPLEIGVAPVGPRSLWQELVAPDQTNPDGEPRRA